MTVEMYEIVQGFLNFCSPTVSTKVISFSVVNLDFRDFVLHEHVTVSLPKLMSEVKWSQWNLCSGLKQIKYVVL